ncbi:MAG TPA: phosphoribosylformylglycinamidine synthase subunit PurS [Thermoplasmata archaeon]|nr:phosphoribosylformylglycinamidine synthase subunit PurS [Thermoplasmata archaeon]
MDAPGPPTRRVEVRVELKPEVQDAEAESVAHSLTLLGVASLKRVRVARVYDLEFEGVDATEAERRAGDAVDKLLANPVVHRVSIRPAPG